MNFTDYVSLVEKMISYAKSYYLDAAPEISDQEWDVYYKQLSDFESSNPKLIDPKSPVGKVGFAMFNETGIAKHSPPMLSLKNAMTIREAENIISATISPAGQYVVEYKADGVACRLCYAGGKFKQALTRGDGLFGEDITRHIDPQLIGVPSTTKHLRDFIVDGELVLKHRDFDSLNAHRASINQEAYKNPRNAVAGMLASDETSIEQKRAISFLAYDLHDSDNDVSWVLNRSKLEAESFELVDIVTGDSFEKIATDIAQKRAGLKYTIDGLVIKLDLYDARECLGNTQHSPRWAFSYKFPAVVGKTVLRAIEFTVGRTGQITARVHFNPVDIGGVTVTKSAIDSLERWIELKPSKDAILSISRRADVRPYVEACESVGGLFHPFTSVCPRCNSKLVVKGKKIFCINETCCGRNIAHITYAVSKDALDINDLSEQKVALLYSNNTITSVANLYTLTPQMLENIGFTKHSADKFVNEINKSKHTTLARVIISLGIPLVASTVANDIARYVNDNKLGGVKETIDIIMDRDQVAKLPIGNGAKESINNYFSIPFYAMRTVLYKDIDFVIKTLSGAMRRGITASLTRAVTPPRVSLK